MKYFTGIVWILLIGYAVYFLYPILIGEAVRERPHPTVICTQDTKVCPDGSSVSRISPNCNFAQCKELPKQVINTQELSGNTLLKVGQSSTVAGVTITLNSFLVDNRCPSDIPCMDGGAVTVNVTLKNKTHTLTRNFPSDEIPFNFYGTYVSIINVLPEAKSTKQIKNDDYRITFHIEK